MNSVINHIQAIRVYLVGFFALLAAVLGLTIWAHLQMPDQIAVHFDGAGHPNRWSGKWEMTGVSLAVLALYTLCFGLFAIFLPRIPHRLWNLPNKAYWLAPERADRSVALFCRDFLVIGMIMVAFMGWIQWDVLRANTVRADKVLETKWWMVLFVIAAVLTMTIRMLLRFRRIPDQPNASSLQPKV